MWIDRELTGRIFHAAETRPAVLLTGARQTGKSSLLQKIFPDHEYVTFDHIRLAQSARESPADFLRQHLEKAVILDEIQYVPELFRELKILIDRDRHNYGKWLLTGSQRFELMEKVSESLAGRISVIGLETMSAKELQQARVPDSDNYIWKGGYPEIWSVEGLDFSDFFESYLRTYIERDLKQIIAVKDLNDFRRFMKLAASRIGQLINYRNISNSLGVSDVTVKKWLHALQISGIAYLLPPYYSNMGKRLIRSPKLYFSDHGLAAHLLNIKSLDDWRSHVCCGNLWENLVLMELIKCHSLTPGENLFFYRDQNGVEIDFIVEQSPAVYLIEAKSGERIEPGKFNFHKVRPLFEKRAKTECFAALNIPESSVLKTKGGISCYNPMKTKLRLYNP